MSISNDDLQRWFAVQVWVGRERLCAAHLRARGYEVLLPSYRDAQQWSDRARRVERALFPGYVFCQMRESTAGKIVTTPGVIRIVGDGSAPSPIPDSEIDAIERIIQAGLDATPCRCVQVGQRVRIVGGPMRGTEGVVVRTGNGTRLIVSISLLQRSVAVDLDAHSVSVA